MQHAIVPLLTSRGIATTEALTKHIDDSSDDRLRRLLGAASMVASSDGLLHTS